MFRSYLFKWLLFLLPGTVCILLNYLFLLHAGELMTLQQIVKRQNGNRDSCIYGTAVHGDTFYYKLEEYAYRQPEITVVGSSRVMQIRESFFSGSFYNLGGTMSNINEGEHFLRMMLTRWKPKLLIIGIDSWWFNDAFLPPKYRDSPLPQQPRLRPEVLFDPFSFLLRRKISVGEYIRTALHDGESTDNRCTIGVSARFAGTGYDPDGSYNYGELLYGKTPQDADAGFAGTLDRIRNGTDRFQYGERVNAEHLAHFLSFVRTAESQGVPVVLFFPPLAPTVWRELDRHRDHYRYFLDLREELRRADIPFVDFENPATVSSTDCEFIDGFHGGSVTAARVLLALARRDPAVQRFVDERKLAETISRAKGRASIADPATGTDRETDFLNIGCHK